MTISLTRARALFSAGELSLVEDARPKTIKKLTAAHLQKRIERTRKLRDKWRDLSHKQQRQTQRARPAAIEEANKRSQEKIALFDELLQSYEARLREVDQQGAPKNAKLLKAKTPKSARQAATRQERAEVRAAIGQKKLALRTASKKKTAAPAAATLVEAAPVAAKKPAPKPTKPVVKKGPPKSAAPVSNLKTGAAAKQKRLAKAGLTTRVQGHVAARGKRQQARRDSKN